MSKYGNLLKKCKELQTEMAYVFNTETDKDIVEGTCYILTGLEKMEKGVTNLYYQDVKEYFVELDAIPDTRFEKILKKIGGVK